MEIPEGMDPQGDESNRRKYVFKLNKSLYGLKQASHNWYEKLKTSLLERDFKPSRIDTCIFLKEGIIVLVYVEDCIIVSDSKARIDVLVHSLQNGKETYILTEEDTINKFLGINITRLDDERYELLQPFLIQIITDYIKTDYPTKINGNHSVTPVGKPLLHKELEGKERKYNWNYCTIVGMTGYLQGGTRPEISMTNHQCARFLNKPMQFTSRQ